MTSTPGGGQPPKLIIDTDWKAQAQAEKAKLSGAPKAGAQPGKPGAPAGQPQGQPQGQAGGQAAGAEGMQVDDDWKRQAQAEKDKLAEGGGARAAGVQGQQTAQFEDLLSMFVSQALLYLGAIPDPRTGQAVVSLEYAKMYIDLLGVIDEKTKGNLTPEESQTLTRTLQELRMEFVEVSKVVAKAIEEGRLRPSQAGGGGGGGPSLKIARAGQVPPAPGT